MSGWRPHIDALAGGRMVGDDRLHITITRGSGAIVIRFAGALDVFLADEARARLDEAINRAVAHSVERVLIDAGRLDFCDSTGLAVFVRAYDSAEARGVQLTLHAVSEPLRALLRLTGLEPLGGRD